MGHQIHKPALKCVLSGLLRHLKPAGKQATWEQQETRSNTLQLLLVYKEAFMVGRPSCTWLWRHLDVCNGGMVVLQGVGGA